MTHSTSQSMETYEVFRRRRQPELRCAVPEGKPKPVFIQDGAWEFDSTLTEPAARPVGFRLRPARHAMQTLGYYLFDAM